MQIKCSSPLPPSQRYCSGRCPGGTSWGTARSLIWCEGGGGGWAKTLLKNAVTCASVYAAMMVVRGGGGVVEVLVAVVVMVEKVVEDVVCAHPLRRQWRVIIKRLLYAKIYSFFSPLYSTVIK